MKKVFNLLFLFQLLNTSFSSICQNFKSNYYYLGEIIDSRNQKNSSIGNVFSENSLLPFPFYLENGLSKYLQNKLETKMVSKVDPYFVHLNLDQIQFVENLSKDLIVNGQFNFKGSFFIITNNDTLTIFPFKYYVKYKRLPAEKEKLVELLNQKLSELNQKLETWFEINYAKNHVLARHVVVKTSDFTPKNIEPDTLYYWQRKITVDDFSIKKTSSGRFAATIFTNMGYQSAVDMSSDTIYLDLQVKVSQVKGMSWILEESKTKFVINHEQTHFDITQLIAEKFKKRLQEEILPANDFDSRLQFLYLEYYRQINKMQTKYDNETEHGLNKIEQVRWEKYVKDELSKYLKINKI